MSNSATTATVLIALGSNISPEQYLPSAVRLLASHPDIEVTDVSSVWESDPVGFHEQANFCNAAIAATTFLSPERLKEELLKLEAQLDRVRDPSNKNGPRTIDLDISIYDSEFVNNHGLEIPDPEIVNRPFLAIPLAEVAGRHKHPSLQVTLAEIAVPFLESSDLRRRSDIDLRAT